MKNLLIFGSGDHAKVVIAEALKSKKKYNTLGFCCNSKKIGKIIFKEKNSQAATCKRRSNGRSRWYSGFPSCFVQSCAVKDESIYWKAIKAGTAKRASPEIPRARTFAGNNPLV